MTVLSRLAGPLLRLPPPESRDISVERVLAADMTDGVVLLADRWFPTRPSGDGPIVLFRTPYGRRIMGRLGRLFAERGYQTVIQSCRGTFGSGGAWVPFRHEQADGHATLELAAGPPWFAGPLATLGASYLGLTQWALAPEPPDVPEGHGPRCDRVRIPRRRVYPGESLRPRDGPELGCTCSSIRSSAFPRPCSGRRCAARKVVARAAGISAARPSRRRGRGEPGAARTRTGSSTASRATSGGT